MSSAGPVDAALPAEKPEDLPEPKNRGTKTRIRLRRIHHPGGR